LVTSALEFAGKRALAVAPARRPGRGTTLQTRHKRGLLTHTLENDMFSCTATTADTSGHTACLCHRPEMRLITDRVNAGFSRRGFMAALAASAADLGLGTSAFGQWQPVASRPKQPILFTNVRLFDGTSPSLRDGVEVLVEGNKIASVHGRGEAVPREAMRIDGAGGVLMPGLIDAHTHLVLATVPLQVAMTAD